MLVLVCALGSVALHSHGVGPAGPLFVPVVAPVTRVGCLVGVLLFGCVFESSGFPFCLCYPAIWWLLLGSNFPGRSGRSWPFWRYGVAPFNSEAVVLCVCFLLERLLPFFPWAGLLLHGASQDAIRFSAACIIFVASVDCFSLLFCCGPRGCWCCGGARLADHRPRFVGRPHVYCASACWPICFPVQSPAARRRCLSVECRCPRWLLAVRCTASAPGCLAEVARRPDRWLVVRLLRMRWSFVSSVVLFCHLLRLCWLGRVVGADGVVFALHPLLRALVRGLLYVCRFLGRRRRVHVFCFLSLTPVLSAPWHFCPCLVIIVSGFVALFLRCPWSSSDPGVPCRIMSLFRVFRFVPFVWLASGRSFRPLGPVSAQR